MVIKFHYQKNLVMLEHLVLREHPVHVVLIGTLCAEQKYPDFSWGDSVPNKTINPGIAQVLRSALQASLQVLQGFV